MASESDAQEKTEDPTQKRIDQALKKGKFYPLRSSLSLRSCLQGFSSIL